MNSSRRSVFELILGPNRESLTDTSVFDAPKSNLPLPREKLPDYSSLETSGAGGSISNDSEAIERIKLQQAALLRRLRLRREELTIIVLPSISVPSDEVESIQGLLSYEQRLLPLVIHLAQLGFRVIAPFSLPVPEPVIWYLLRLVDEPEQVEERIHILVVNDPDRRRCLASKLLAQPDMLSRMAAMIDPERTILLPWNATIDECRLAQILQVPVLGPDPSLQWWGTKSGGLVSAEASAVPRPYGVANINSVKSLTAGVDRIWKHASLLRMLHFWSKPKPVRFFVKRNEGVSGLGIGTGYLPARNAWLIRRRQRNEIIVNAISSLDLQDENSNVTAFLQLLFQSGGIVELSAGERCPSPSVQSFVRPDMDYDRVEAIGRRLSDGALANKIVVLSTHEQRFKPGHELVYSGSSYPAADAYREALVMLMIVKALYLRRMGYIGFMAADYVARPVNVPKLLEAPFHLLQRGLRRAISSAALCKMFLHAGKLLRGKGIAERLGGKALQLLAIRLTAVITGYWIKEVENNLRVAGNLHYFLLVLMALDATHDWEQGQLVNELGRIFYEGTDNFTEQALVGLRIDDLLDLSAVHELLPRPGNAPAGSILHMLSLLHQGRLGIAAASDSRDGAAQQMKETQDQVVKLANQLHNLRGNGQGEPETQSNE